MEIRQATAADIDHLVSFNQAMALETEGKSLEPDTLRDAVSAVFADEHKGFYVVASIDQEVAAGLLVTFEWSDWRNAWWWWIQSVYVLPDFRGRAVYSRMYDFVKQRGAERGGVCGFRLYVERENEGAQRVYERNGMERSQYLMYEAKTVMPES